MERKKGKKPGKTAARVQDGTPDTSGENLPDHRVRIPALVLVVAILGIAVLFGFHLIGPSPIAPSAPGTLTVWYFYGTGCEHCVYTTPYVESLRQKYPDVNFRILEIYENPTNRDILISMNQRLNQNKTGVPVAFVGNIVLLGGDEIPRSLEGVIINQTRRAGLP